MCQRSASAFAASTLTLLLWLHVRSSAMCVSMRNHCGYIGFRVGFHCELTGPHHASVG